MDDLKANNLVSSGCAELLESTFSAVPGELTKILVSQKANNNLGAYAPELRAFAMALKFYSSKAYNYLRESFDKEIKWQYLIELKKLQGAKGLRLANKLRSAHINWKPQKMKVNLAAQALSWSVANALEFCEGEIATISRFVVRQ